MSSGHVEYSHRSTDSRRELPERNESLRQTGYTSSYDRTMRGSYRRRCSRDIDPHPYSSGRTADRSRCSRSVAFTNSATTNRFTFATNMSQYSCSGGRSCRAVRLRGLPFNLTPKEVLEFLRGFSVQSLLPGTVDGGGRSGVAYVEFADPYEAQRAVRKLHRTKIYRRSIEVVLSTMAEFKLAAHGFNSQEVKQRLDLMRKGSVSQIIDG
eukprot:Lankesteria_metandrocarpae@DN4520_c0_g1_i5.p2